MKKRYVLLILLLILIPFNTKALEYKVTNSYKDISILEDGNLNIKEIIVLSGSFEKYDLYINYYSYFVGIGDNVEFLRDTIYRPQAIDVTRIEEVVVPKEITYDNMFQSELVTVDNTYTTGDAVADVTIKSNALKEVKAFYIEYVVLNSVVGHNDYNELFLPVTGYNQEDIENFECRIHLPKESDTLKAFGHATNGAFVATINNKDAILTAFNIPSLEDTLIRVVFDKDIVNPVKKSNVSSYNKILLAEDHLKIEYDGLKEEYLTKIRLKQIYQIVIIGVNIIYYVILLFILLKIYFKHDKEYKNTFNKKYLKELPATYGPELLEFLLDHSVSSKALAASLLEIIRKKGLIIEVIGVGEDDYILKKNTPTIELTPAEEYLRNWFLEGVGTREFVSIKQIKKAGSTSSKRIYFNEKYSHWRLKAELEMSKEEFYEEESKLKISSFLYTFIGTILLYYFNVKTHSGYITGSYLVFIPMLFIIWYIIVFRKRTIKGNDEYVKWIAFKRYLKDFNTFSEHDDKDKWEEYLSYATVFKMGSKLKQEMLERNSNLNSDDHPLFKTYGISFDPVVKIPEAVRKAFISARVINTTSSYGVSKPVTGGYGVTITKEDK